jgi:glycosyltransferase involved in cell wall biosynthesis
MVDVALLHHQYGPYHVARARALERRFRGRVHLIQLASHEASREWRRAGESPTILTAAEGTLETLSGRDVARGLIELLERLQPGALVVAGYAHPAMRAAARWGRRNRAASILLSDSHRADRRRHGVKELAKRIWLARHFHAVFAAGATSAMYASTLGFGASRIWRGYDVVDNAFFAERAAAGRPIGESLLRDLGLPDRVFLYVGRFSPEKNLDRLLDAMTEYRRRAGAAAWGLLMVGSGPQAEALARRIGSLSGSVAMLGFKQAEELAQIYGACAALILPSTSEPWGLVVNEAMAAGLPVLASDRVGAVFDLVFPGINGYVFDAESTRDMTEAMLRLSSQEVDASSMGLASARIVSNFTPDTWATALADCIEVTVQRQTTGA